MVSQVRRDAITDSSHHAVHGRTGHARRVIATNDDTTFIAGKGEKHAIQARIAQRRGQMKEATSEYHRDHLQERLAKLAGGVGVIRVPVPPMEY